MKISIDSTKPITENYLLDLSNNRINFKLDKNFNLDEGWYELNLPYTGQKTEIKDVKINDESIVETLWAGHYLDGKGNKNLF